MKRTRSELVVGAVAVALMVALPAGAVVSRGDGGRQVAQAGAAQARSGPYMTGLPAVSGTPQEGETLTATPGTWGGTTPITYSYRWQRCGLTELIANPGIEGGAEGWSGRRGATVSQSSEQAHGGGSSLKVQTPGKQMGEGASYQLASVTPGASYTFRAWAWVGAETTFIVGIRYYDAAGAEIGGGPVSGRWGGLWSQIAVTVTAPAGAASATVEMTTDRTAGTFYLDDASFLDCANISGATSPSYPVVAADAGFRLLVRIAASNSVNTTWVVSDPTAMALDKWSTAPAYTGPVFADNTEAAAADPPAPPPVTTTLPTWRNLYDWPNGHGYVGWHYNTSATDSRYSSASNHGGNHGLWIWPTGDQQYTPNHAEWTYTAPGTTRLSTANLTFSYRNKLLAHHCIQVGLRTLDGTTIQEYKWCQPALPPDSQREVSLALQDPLNNPTSKVLYFRVEMPECNNPDPTPCSKYIPTLDPLGPGGYARLKLADMILVDDDNPTLTPSGALFDIRDTYINGTQTYGVTVHADEAGSGVVKGWLERQGFQAPAGTLSSQEAPCDAQHNTPPLDARICPATFEFQTSVDSNTLAEGTSHFFEKAKDLAGNVGSSAEWKFYIDRTPPAVPANIHLAAFDSAGAFASIGWDASADPGLPDGIPGSGTDHYRFRYQRNGNGWTDWQTTLVPSLGVSATGGDVLNIEVTAADAVGNESAPGAASITIPASDDDGDFANPPGSELTQPFSNPTLTSEQVAQAVSATESAPAFITLVGGRSYTIAGTQGWGPDAGPDLIGAVVTVNLDQPAAIDGDWPQILDNGDGTRTTASFHYDLTNVTTIDSYVDLPSGTVMGLDPNPDAVWANAPPTQPGVQSSTTLNASLRSFASVNRSTIAAQEEEEDPADHGSGRGTNKLHLLCTDGQNCWLNYDFATSAKDADSPKWNKVDWPVTFLWTGQSNINKVKAYLEYELGWNSRGSAMAAVVQMKPDGTGRVWDTDKGKKERLCTFHFKSPHTRLYADPGTDFLFSLAYGNYVLGTTHFDWAECTDYLLKLAPWPLPSPRVSGAGYSEGAEELLLSQLRFALAVAPPYAATSIQEDALYLANDEHYTHGSHHGDNNGRATIIRLGATR